MATLSFRHWMLLFLAGLFMGCPRANSQVFINEVVAASSSRLLSRESGEHPRIGNTLSWTDPEFDDSRWSEGAGPFGFGSFAGVDYGTPLPGNMRNNARALYLRSGFEAEANDALSEKPLVFNIRYNDGVIISINGLEVLRRNMGRPGMHVWHDQSAYAVSSGGWVRVEAGPASRYLKAGTNTICVQVNHLDYDATLLFAGNLSLGGEKTLVGGESVWRYFPGYVEPAGSLLDYGLLERYFAQRAGVAWAGLPFDASGWRTAAGPVGIDEGGEYLPAVDLSGEARGATSFYTRRVFEVSREEAASSHPLTMTLDYDDAVIVYLNGHEVARRNAGAQGAPVPYDAIAASVHKANNASGTVTGREETLALAPAKDLLRPGNNILAVQCLRASVQDKDAIARVSLLSGESGKILVSPEDEVAFFSGVSEPVNLSLSPEDFPDAEHDWIELANDSNEDISLEGWRLTDNPSNPAKWTFPAGATIPARGHLVVVASGLNLDPLRDGTDYHHCAFELSSSGEYLGLINPDGVVVSEAHPGFPPAHPGYSWSRRPDGSFGWSGISTPGAVNHPAILAAPPEPPAFYPAGGFHDQPVTVSLTSFPAGAKIRYTLDGSEPTAENGTDYRAPFTVNRNCFVRARAFLPGSRPSGVTGRTFLINEPAARRTVPALCLGGDAKLTFYGPNGGVPGGEGIMAIEGGVLGADWVWLHDGNPASFNNAQLRGRASEKPATIEFLPIDGGTGLRAEAGLRVSGSGNLRPRYLLRNGANEMFSPYMPRDKPSFNVFFRSDFGGERPLVYPFFPGSPVNSFEDIRLRAGKNDHDTPFIIDELMRRLYLGTGQKGSRGIFTALYINGVYKGYYNMCERLRDGFMRAHHGGNAAWDVLQNGVVANGDLVEWNRFRKFLRTADFSRAEEYSQIHDYLDVDNFIDYLLVNIYGATLDWPHNNWVTSRERTPLGRWRFYIWDAEGAFGRMGGGVAPDSFDMVQTVLKMSRPAALNATNQFAIPAIYSLLSESPEFRLRFADRIRGHFFHSGALTRERMKSLYQELKAQVDPIMRSTIGVGVRDDFYHEWIDTEVRREAVFDHFVSADLWPEVSPPEVAPHGGEAGAGQSVVISGAGQGSIYYTVDGTDPRLPGGEPSGLVYQHPLEYDGFKTIRARFRSASGEWSAETVAVFNDPREEHRFLPPGDGEWNSPGNWSAGSTPESPGASVWFDAPPSGSRNVGLSEPVTAGSLHFQLGGAGGRSRLRGNSEEAGLTFDNGQSQALLEVKGAGSGYVEVDLEAGVRLKNDLKLDVSAYPGHAEHGALRLRGGWEGPGGIYKTGPGIVSLTGDGKSFTGPVTVAEGTLVLTEPAAPRRASRLRVEEGGQLLLTSGEYGVRRRYEFHAPLSLAGSGRAGDLSGSAQGALRYQPEGGGNHAVVATPVGLTAETRVHVEGATNVMELSMPVSGGHGMVKTGTGELRLSAAAALTAPVRVSGGTLALENDLPAAVVLDKGAVLSGYGSCSGIEGEGEVLLDGTMMRTPAVEADSYTFVFRAHSPDFGNKRESGNAVLRVSQAAPQGKTLNFYIEFPEPAASPRTGGFFVPSSVGLASAARSMALRVFNADPNGTHVFKDRNWTQVQNARLAVVPAVADFGEGPVEGETLQISYTDLFDQWRAAVFPDPADRANPLVSGPEADPDGDGMSNLMEYAFGLHPRVADASDSKEASGEITSRGMPAIRANPETGEAEILFTRRSLPDDSVLSVRPQFSDDLRNWLDSADPVTRVAGDGEVEMMSLAFPRISQEGNSRFFRLKIELTPPEEREGEGEDEG